ncbi:MULTISPECIES: NUDIX hydrolase [unclassified Pantoea]|uniref:NUDIX hydrolase n=1 Tax=unclassified Pantoea TaxID=2630326 RepID=UPI0021C80004|nr:MULTISPECIES: NUDIX hydrolase [unclassified Pantoea]
MNKVIFENNMLSVSVDKMRHLKLHQKNGGVVIIAAHENKYAIIQHIRNSEVLYEFPRGFLEAGESHLIGGERELKEELNLESSNSHLLGQLLTDSGLISDNIQVILCEVDDIDQLSPQKNEGIMCCKFYSREEIFDMIKQGLIKDNFTLSSIILLITKNSS